jgi:hypothetical protein
MMNPIYWDFGAARSSRRVRRTVVVLYSMMWSATVVVSLLMDRRGTEQLTGPWAASLYGALAASGPAFFRGFQRSRAIRDDERYRIQHEAARRIGYRVLQALLSVCFICVVGLASHGEIAFLILFVLFATVWIPDAILAWIEPDPPPDED